MPRKRKLDKWVTSFVDRNGKERFRFRREGVSHYLPPPGSKEYADAYKRAVSGTGGSDNVREGSVDDLISRLYRTVKFRSASEGWQRIMRGSLEPFREEFGKDMVRNFRPKDIDAILEARFEKRVVDGKTVGGSASAERLREMLMRLFKLGVKLEMIDSNPVEHSEPVRHQGKGFRTWTEADIAKFRKHWGLGTKARLAMELMLWTGARGGNAHTMRPPVNGRIREIAVKTKKVIDIPVAPALQAAIDAMPKGSIGETLVINEHGRPFTRKGFGNKMREWCDQAGLPQCTAHGLRRSLATRAAHAKVPQQSLKALGQWSQDKEVATYTEDANRIQLAEEALAAVVEWERVKNIG